MSADHLIRDEVLQVDKALIDKIDDAVLASIDSGSTLIKILYVTEASSDKDSGKCELHFALFWNKHFDSALAYLKTKLDGQKTAGEDGAKRLHVTGVGANLHGDKIRAVLGVDTIFIDEAVSQFRGFYFLLKHLAKEAICHPLPTFDDSDYEGIQRGETFQRIRDAQAALMKQNESGDKFPCLFAICGSSAGIALVSEDGSIQVKHRHLLAGKSFLGLCKILVGTSNYQEIMDMAARGKRGNIDTQVRDILADSPNSPYGRMPASLPFFPFGKAVDFDKSLEDTKPEDVAQSLVSSFTVNFTNIVSFVASFERVRNVYFGGNFFQHEFSRIEVMKNVKLFGTSEIMSCNFLNTGHTAALGALLSSTEDVTDFFAKMKIKG